MNLGLSLKLAVVVTLLCLSTANAAALSSADADRTTTEQIVSANLSAVAVLDVQKQKGFFDGLVQKIEKGDVSLPPALLLFGIALAAIGWLGRKRKKSNIIRD